jgi:hypothetical protein
MGQVYMVPAASGSVIDLGLDEVLEDTSASLTRLSMNFAMRMRRFRNVSF